MVAIKRSELRILDDALDMHGGYVLNFSDRTFSEFFEDEVTLAKRACGEVDRLDP